MPNPLVTLIKWFIIPDLFFRKKGTLISYQRESVVHPSITFLVVVSSPKPLDVEILQVYRSHDVEELGSISGGLDHKVKKCIFLKCISYSVELSNLKLCRCIGHMM